MQIASPQTRVNLPATKLFELASNCQNFARFLSEQAKDITATEDTCSFTIENIAKITLKILDKTPFSSIRFVAENDKNIPLFIQLDYTEISENETDVVANLDIDLPIFLKPVLQTPLQRFMDSLSEKIKTETEKFRA
jgi:hypothetical protein